jgi:hypothetical protein
MARKLLCVAVGVAVGLALLAGPVSARSASATKILFKLDDHQVSAGGVVTGSLLVLTKGEILWWPLPNAELTVSVDDARVGTVTTDLIGFARVSVPASALGEHAIEVSYPGDAAHHPARRSQGFTVTPGEAPPLGAPNAPLLTGEAPVAGLNYLQWEVPADNGSPITGYRVYRRTSGEPFSLLLTKGSTAFSADDVQVTSGQTYVYAVTAVNAVGESSMSNEVAITAM